MAETVIFAEQTLEFSDDSSGLYIAQNKEPFVLESGKTYRVIWDGEEFTLNSFNFLMEGFEGIGIGNEAFFTGVSTELTEPFSVYYLTSSGYSAIVTTDNSASHTVAIYLVEESLSVVVKDRTGADVGYSGVAGIRVRTTDDDEKVFVDSDTIPDPMEAEISLDFSGGDMEVSPESGKVFSKVAIRKPGMLLPGNIADGVEIAGIFGTKMPGATGTERTTILPEQTITPTFSNSDGCYKATLSPSEAIKGEAAYAVCFDGTWYVCVEISHGADIGALVGTAVACFGNYVIRKKFYNNAITWAYEKGADRYPFCFDTYSDFWVGDSESHTIRIDKLVITE